MVLVWEKRAWNKSYTEREKKVIAHARKKFALGLWGKSECAFDGDAEKRYYESKNKSSFIRTARSISESDLVWLCFC